MATTRHRVETLNYRAGGFHPVHLNDDFKSDRYRVLHKLGHGGFATVWLARDSVRNRYVALKILAARLSKDCPEVEILRRLRNWGGDNKGKAYVMSLLDHFWIDGPNGRHLCVVGEVGGPSIKQFNDSPGLRAGSRRLKGHVARRVALQATEGLGFIHSTGTVHGDLTAANILLRLANIDEWTMEEIHERLGEPQMQDLHHKSRDGPIDRSQISTPDYTVNAISMKLVNPKWLSDQIMIIDFGIAFLEDDSSAAVSFIGTPKNYCAPEFEFEGHRTTKSDIWALGCTIFEIRTGSCLFQYRGVPTRDQMLVEMVKILGGLPNLWWEAWKKGRNWYELQRIPGGQLEGIPNGTLHDLIMEIGVHDGDIKVGRTKKPDMGFQRSSSSEEKKRHSSGSSERLNTTKRLVDLVEDLTTSEAAQILALIGKKENLGQGNSGSSQEKTGSSNSNRTNQSGSSGTKSGEKSISSEGVSTGAPPTDPPVTVSGSVTQGMPGIPEIASAVEFLEQSGTVILPHEAASLEKLLRDALVFLPEKRATAWELSKHQWFPEKLEMQDNISLDLQEVTRHLDEGVPTYAN